MTISLLNSPSVLAADWGDLTIQMILFLIAAGVFVLIGMFAALSRFYRKVGPEEALVITGGRGGIKAVTGTGTIVIPVLHRAEVMDLSVKRIEISRRGETGLICRDNIRADIEVAFFVRVSAETKDIIDVAGRVGTARASDPEKLRELYDAKFSEALKTVGKRFDFVELYNERDKFKDEIIKVIGRDLDGYKFEDCAIDYLEQTALEKLNPNNILDAEGIKKITRLTADEHILANEITREKEKVIKKQDVEAQETILELERQRVEAVQKQEREIAAVTAREQAEAAKVREQERLRAEEARIQTEEAIQIAEENRERQVIVAQRNRERTDKVEMERVEKDRLLEVTERNRIVGLADIEKEKAIEAEKRNIQEVIRERVMVERAVVEEQERIKDTQEFATADRAKQVAVTSAEQAAEEALIRDVKAAEAAKTAASLLAEQVRVEAEARRDAAQSEMDAKKYLAEATAAEEAARGLAEAQVIEAKASALELQGTSEANVIQKKAVAEAKGMEAKATAVEKEGMAEAAVLKEKYSAEAAGIEEKAEAMKVLDGVGKEHEEFKLRLQKDKDVEIAAIHAQQEIAESQAAVVSEALKTARIDIVGGETTFFDRITQAVEGGKAVDRFIQNSETLTDVKNTFFNGNPEYFRDQLQTFVGQFNMSFDDVKDLSVTALVTRLLSMSDSDETTMSLDRLLRMAQDAGIAGKRVGSITDASKSS